MKASALPGKPLWGGPSRVLAAGACRLPCSPEHPYRHPSRRRVVRRASRSGCGRPRESTLIGRQTSLNINGLGVMFIAVTRGGAGLPPTFGKEAREGRAGCAPTVPAGREGWAPRSRGCPCPSRPTGLHLPLRRQARGGGQRDGLGYGPRLPFARKKQAACPIPAAWRHRSRQWPGQRLPAQRRAIPGGPAAPRHSRVRGASLPSSGYQDAAPLGAVPAPAGEASCQASCSIQFALISQSASGSHAPKPISAAVTGGSRPQGSAPLAMPRARPRPRSAGARNPRQLSSGAAG